MHKQLPN